MLSATTFTEVDPEAAANVAADIQAADAVGPDITIAGDLVLNANEDAGSFTGVLTASEPDGLLDLEFNPTTNEAGNNGFFSIDAEGNWTYVPTVDFALLGPDEVLTDSFQVFAIDANATGDAQIPLQEATVTINIQGLDGDGNSNSVDISGDLLLNTNEDATAFTGSLSAVDLEELLPLSFAPILDAPGQRGNFSISDEGDWTYTPGVELQSLRADQSITETFSVNVGDPFFPLATATVTINIEGRNDQAVISGDLIINAGDEVDAPLTGTLFVADVDDGESSFFAADQTGTYGSLSLLDSGDWTYTIDAAASENLAAGETDIDSFTIQSIDGTTETLQFTVEGQPGETVITGELAGSVLENNLNAIPKFLAATDGNGNAIGFVAQTVQTEFGEFIVAFSDLVNASLWTYRITMPEIDFLDAGETIEETFTVEAVDGTTAEVLVTIIGRDQIEFPFSGDLTGSISENALAPITGTAELLYQEDFDEGIETAEALIVPAAFVPGVESSQLGDFQINESGEWTFTLSNAAQSLTAGEAVTQSFAVTADAISVSGTVNRLVSSIEITVIGENDAAIFGGVLTGATTEDATALVTGTATVTDFDPGEAEIVASAATGNFGSFEINSSGEWTYAVDNGLTDSLAATDSVVDEFTISSTDGTTQTISVSITGENDSATIAGQLTGSTDEDATAAVTGTATVDDIDAGEASIVASTAVGSFGSFAINTSGEWTYEVDNAAAQILTDGDAVDEAFTIMSVDGTEATVVVTVTGENDSATIAGQLTGSTDEDATLAVTGTATVDDIDAGEASIVASTAVGSFGSFAIDTSGEWTYAVDNAAAQILTDGDAVDETFTIMSVDGTEATVVVTVTGENDSATIAGQLTGSTDEDATAAVTGTATVDDIDAGEASIVASTAVGSFGSFAINTSGEWTYEVDNAAAQILTDGDAVDEAFTIMSVDGTEATVVVTVTGENDSATIAGQLTGSTDEDATLAVTGTATVDDIDAGEASIVASTAVGIFGSFAIDTSGEWTYAVDNAAAQGLNDGDAIDEAFTITSVDGTEATVVVTVTGQDDNVDVVPVQITDGVLVIQGTDDSDDQVDVRRIAGGDIQVTVNGVVSVFSASDVDSINISGGDGDDNLVLANNISIDATIDGGAGDDLITGGRGDDLLLGGEGDDTINGRGGNDLVLGQTGMDELFGNGGRDILIGGDEADVIRGGGGQDLMIGGLINFADDEDLLNRLRDEWAASRSFNARASNIVNGTGPIMDGFRIRIGETVFSDGVQDDVNGGRGRDGLI